MASFWPRFPQLKKHKEVPLSSFKLSQLQVMSWPGHRSSWGRAEALGPAAWPPVLACPELKRLDLQGRKQPVELNFTERARESVSHARSQREAGGGRELGTEASWVGQKKRRGRIG